MCDETFFPGEIEQKRESQGEESTIKSSSISFNSN